MMKKLLTLLGTWLAVLSVNSQVVTTSPAIVQQNSSPIVITFHADQGSKGLANLPASTAVYAHTGVILEGSNEWSYAPSWGDNSSKYKLTYVSANTYTLTIPSIQEYYGIKANEKVSKLAFVFRNSDGTKEGKTADGGDIFVDVFDNSFAAKISVSPADLVYTQPATLTVTVNTTQPSQIKLFVNNTTDVMAEDANATSLTYKYNINTNGNYTFIAQATNAAGQTATDSYTICKIGNSVSANYPGGVPKMGPVANADGSVTFCMAAPGKTTGMIVGSWNDYVMDANQVMNYQDYNGYRYFWITIPNLGDGKDYIYYFNYDGDKNVGDPYARLVLDPWNDKYIPASTFPNLPEYPSAKVNGVPLAVYNSNDGKYDWKVKNFKGVDQSNLIIYELLIRDFSGTEGKSNAEGNIAGVMAKLDYLQKLGVNAIELLPIMEFNGNNSWGYNTNFYFAPDKFYGTPDDYRALIDAIHQRGMAVILDIVFNQSDGLHPWYQLYPIAQNPFYNGSAPHAYSVLNDWNQDNLLVQQQFKDAVKYWITEYHVDGYRFDLVKGLGSNQSYNATYNPSTNTWSGVTDAKTNAYNASRVARMKELHNAMREVKPDAYFINENLAGAQEENEMAQDGEINWANINNASCQFAMGYQSDSNMNRFYAPQDSRTWGSTVSYAESHDEERMAYKVAQYGASGVKGNVEMTCRRLGSVGAQMLMTPGAHMIWQFQEFGADQTTKNSDGGNNTDPKKVIWSYLDEPNHEGLMQSYMELCHLRTDNPEMFVEGVTTTMNLGQASWTNGRAVELISGDKALFLVVNPKTSSDLTYTLLNANTSTEYQLLSASYGTNPTMNGKQVKVPAGGYAVFGTMNMVDAPQIDADVANMVKVYGGNGEIIVSGDYQQLNAYTTSGMEVNPKGNLAPGIYIVLVDGNATKVVVR